MSHVFQFPVTAWKTVVYLHKINALSFYNGLNLWYMWTITRCWSGVGKDYFCQPLKLSLPAVVWILIDLSKTCIIEMYGFHTHAVIETTTAEHIPPQKYFHFRDLKIWPMTVICNSELVLCICRFRNFSFHDLDL